MKEIAEQTGVSISTVSLVLNGRDEGRVNPALAKLVRNKATELGYKINPLARSLRTNKTRILGFISEEVATTPYAGGIILARRTRPAPTATCCSPSAPTARRARKTRSPH